jgi:hypothetical protein
VVALLLAWPLLLHLVPLLLPALLLPLLLVLLLLPVCKR